jgi:condensin-2 complex subunit H2
LHHQEGPTFEELCRSHIQKFARGAELYAVETHLNQRVNQWQSRLKPLLDEEENRTSFDIHEYGAVVVDFMETKSKILIDQQTGKSDVAATEVVTKSFVDFRDISRNCEQYEVCRMFLASLSLCNSGNIIFADPESRESPSSSLPMKLLKSNIARPMNTYLAPSVQTTTSKENNS